MVAKFQSKFEKSPELACSIASSLLDQPVLSLIPLLRASLIYFNKIETQKYFFFSCIETSRPGWSNGSVSQQRHLHLWVGS